MGWLHACPDKRKNERGDKSRLQAMQDRGELPHLPDNPAPYLIAWLFDIGPSNGMCEIGYRDLAAWQEVTGVALLPWEASTLRTTAKSYLIEREEATDAGRIAPYLGPREQARATVDDKIRSAFRNLKKA